jgi:membrane-associated phospholipid phosphatase
LKRCFFSFVLFSFMNISVRLILFIFLGGFCTMELSAQIDTNRQKDLRLKNITSYRNGDWYNHHGYRINRTYLKSYFTDFPKVAAAPLHYTPKDWRNVAIITGTTGVFLLADRSINSIMKANQNEFLHEAAEVIEPFGNLYPPLIIGALYLTGVITKERRIEHASLMAAKSLVFSIAFYTVTKSLIRRQRPLYTDNPFVFKAPFQGGKEYTSFPSGHTNAAFTVATALAIEFRQTKWVAPVAYSIAALTGVSRMYQNRHWSSDVFVGAVFGHFITRALYRVEQKKNEKKELSLNF